MNSKEYIKKVLLTESNDYEKIKSRIATRRNVRLLHAAIGKVTEAAELIDQLKKFIFYGKDLDGVNLIEEIGDSNWYDALLLDELDSSFEIAWDRNINKLQKRYGDKFSEERANERDLEEERKVLENDKELDDIITNIVSTKCAYTKCPTKQITLGQSAIKFIGYDDLYMHLTCYEIWKGYIIK